MGVDATAQRCVVYYSQQYVDEDINICAGMAGGRLATWQKIDGRRRRSKAGARASTTTKTSGRQNAQGPVGPRRMARHHQPAMPKHGGQPLAGAEEELLLGGGDRRNHGASSGGTGS